MPLYRMHGKGQGSPPKSLFHVVTQIEKDRYTLIEQSTHYIWSNTTHSYIESHQFIISLAIALHDAYMQLSHIMCIMSLLSSQLYSLTLSIILSMIGASLSDPHHIWGEPQRAPPYVEVNSEICLLACLIAYLLA